MRSRCLIVNSEFVLYLIHGYVMCSMNARLFLVMLVLFILAVHFIQVNFSHTVNVNIVGLKNTVGTRVSGLVLRTAASLLPIKFLMVELDINSL